MPTTYVVTDTDNGKWVSAYTNPTNYQETNSIGLVPIRTEGECNTIATALNNATTAGRFAVGPRPKP